MALATSQKKLDAHLARIQELGLERYAPLFEYFGYATRNDLNALSVDPKAFMRGPTEVRPDVTWLLTCASRCGASISTPGTPPGTDTTLTADPPGWTGDDMP